MLKKNIKLSICIPTYNRAKFLENCLNSIFIAKSFSAIRFEVCISDNCSDDNIDSIIKKYKKKLNITYKKNKKNLGFGINFIKVVKMARGEFIWVIGNDDLLYPYSLKKLEKTFTQESEINFFFINSSNLNSKFVFSCKQPFDTNKIPKNLKSFSKILKNKKVDFFKLINPSVSWDFMLGIFLSIYKRKIFLKQINLLNKKKLNDQRTWSTLENTAPHVIAFSRAFRESKSFIHADPLSVNLFGEKEWSSTYPFIAIIRIPEILDIYRKNGLDFFTYVKCKNFALKNFIPYMYFIFKNKKISNFQYVSFKKHIFNNIFYPNIYIYGFIHILKKLLNNLLRFFK